MLSVRLFGGTSIEGKDGPLTGPATQRHRLALLALLAATHPRPLSRDKLIAYLWPERDLERARNLLSQAVHRLRKALGEHAIRTAADEVRLEPGAIAVDVLLFRDALAAGDLERAVHLYSGPFLDGFFLSGAPGFEQWAEGERERFRHAYHRALEGLAEGAEARADPTTAVDWWRRLAAEDPYNSRVTLRLMEALEAAGDGAGAIQQARLHAALLKQELDADVHPEVTALAERMRIGVGVPAIARERGQSGSVAAPSVQAEGTGEGRTTTQRLTPAIASPGTPVRVRRTAWRSVGLASGLVLGLGVALSVAWLLPEWNPRPDNAAAAPVTRTPAIAVLPFENLTGMEQDAPFVNGIHSDLITALSGVGALTVISRASVLPYRDRTRPLSEIGAELDVDVLLEGGVQRLGDRLRVNTQLSEAGTGRLLWADSYDHQLTVGDIFVLQSEITRRIVASLEASLTETELARLAVPPTQDLTAYEYYHRAAEVYDGTRAGNEEAERLLRLALQVDSLFAPAWASLAANYGWRPPYLGYPTAAWDSALAYARRAVDADPDFGGGYTVLAVTYGHQGQLERQERMAREALRRNPNNALAMRRLAESHRERGAFVEALRYHRESVRLSPNGLHYRTWVGYTYMDVGELAEAERWYRDVLSLQSDYMNALQGLAILHLQRAQSDSALHYSDRALARYPEETIALANATMIGHFLGDHDRVKRHAGRAIEIAEPGAPVRELYSLLATTMLGFAHLQTGDSVRANMLFAESLAFLEDMVARGTDTPHWPYEIALIHGARGDVENAITWLQTAYDRGFRWTWRLEREPMLEPLREDPRFRGLVARVRADVQEARRQAVRADTCAGPGRVLDGGQGGEDRDGELLRRLLQEMPRFRAGAQQPLDFHSKLCIPGTGGVQEGATPVGRRVQRGIEQTLHLLPPLTRRQVGHARGIDRGFRLDPVRTSRSRRSNITVGREKENVLDSDGLAAFLPVPASSAILRDPKPH